jgi:membrane fusion protein, heavy metal efflux system
MPIHDHQPAFRGRVFLWGGIGLGVLFLVGFLTHGFGLIGAGGKGAEAPELMTRQGDKIVVPEGSSLRSRLTIESASARPINVKYILPATIESDPARTTPVLPALGGRVIRLAVGLGDRVTRGQVLVVIDSPDLAQAFDDDDKAADALKLTQKNLERQEGQNKIGVASDRDLDQARSDNTQATAEYARTQARLKVLGALPGNPASKHLLTVTAPMSGSITTLAVAPGVMINDPTQPMMTVADLSSVWVTAMVPEKDVADVTKNLDAEIRLVAYPGRPLHGKVLFVSDVIELDSRRNKIRIALENRDYSLKPNMFATVTVSGPNQSQVVLPSSALLMNNDRTSVFVATAPWTFERRVIDPQLEDGPSVAIRSGVAAGEQVVVKGGILLND